MTVGMCKSYCTHGGRCVLASGHAGNHDSDYCKWTDEQALTHEQANTILRTKDGGDDYVDYMEPVADFIEAQLDAEEETW